VKAAAIEWVRAEHLEQVFELLEQYGDEARLLAGGQTLLATLNMRLSEPSVLIDINDVRGLDRIEVKGTQLCLGALVTHTEIEESALVAQHAPLLTLAAPHIGHRAIRNRGTWGGSIAFADPAAEWPTCALALDATLIVASRRGERRIAAQDFFLNLYTTALEPDEVLVATEIPVRHEHDVCAFEELARRHGDYAIVGLAAQARLTNDTFAHVRLAYLGVAVTPLRTRRTELVLEGQRFTDGIYENAAQTLRAELSGPLEPIADLTNSAAMKRLLAVALLRRAIATMVARK